MISFLRFIAIGFPFLFWCLVIMIDDNSLVEAGNQKLIIPAYFYPGQDWIKINSASNVIGIVIANPNSGPGSSSDSTYKNQIKITQKTGISVIGYVHTSYGKRKIDTVKKEISNWVKWYNIKGIFLDEVPNDYDDPTGNLYLNYYKDLNSFIKSKITNGITVLNPGSFPPESYLTAGDIICTFESPYSNYKKTVGNYSPRPWVSNYAADRFYHIVFNVNSTANLQDTITLSNQRNAKYLYVTSLNLPNPYARLPPATFWNKEVTLLK
jgi:hypothetical protein